MRALLTACLLATLPCAALADRITVFAAASLQGPLDEAAANWGEATGHEVVLSYGGTSALARQILTGAPSDLFIAASEDWMDEVAKGGAILPDSRTDLLGNSLVLIGPADAPALDLADPAALVERLGDGRLSMALVDAVPAGQYGKAALEALNLWQTVETSVAQADNVRGAMALVALGEAPLGIVYATDALAEPRVAVVAAFDAATHPQILYPAAITSGSELPETAQALLDYLAGAEAQALFAAAGFTPPDGP